MQNYYEQVYHDCAYSCPPLDFDCFGLCARDYEQGIQGCPCQSGCPLGCPCVNYCSNPTTDSTTSSTTQSLTTATAITTSSAIVTSTTSIVSDCPYVLAHCQCSNRCARSNFNNDGVIVGHKSKG